MAYIYYATLFDNNGAFHTLTKAIQTSHAQKRVFM